MPRSPTARPRWRGRCTSANARMAEALLDAGAKVNTADEYGETPVTLAAANGDAALVERLLAAGGNARAARWNGETARHDCGGRREPRRRRGAGAARRRCERRRSRAAVKPR